MVCLMTSINMDSRYYHLKPIWGVSAPHLAVGTEAAMYTGQKLAVAFRGRSVLGGAVEESGGDGCGGIGFHKGIKGFGCDGRAERDLGHEPSSRTT